jgi:hypothetical protein
MSSFLLPPAIRVQGAETGVPGGQQERLEEGDVQKDRGDRVGPAAAVPARPITTENTATGRCSTPETRPGRPAASPAREGGVL